MTVNGVCQCLQPGKSGPGAVYIEVSLSSGIIQVYSCKVLPSRPSGTEIKHCNLVRVLLGCRTRILTL